MAGKGNPKGTNRGGGMRKGQVSRKVRERTMAPVYEQVAEAVKPKVARVRKAAAPPVTPPRARLKLGKEILEEAANYFFGLAAQHQPGAEKADVKLFETYLEKAADIAAKVAPYQSPRLSNVAVTPQPIDLTKLSDGELDQLERIYAKARAAGGDTGGEAASVH